MRCFQGGSESEISEAEEVNDEWSHVSGGMGL